MSLKKIIKNDNALRTIGEVGEALDLPTHVLRFWESKFLQIKPTKRRGGHRYYRPEDVVIIKEIKSLLYERGYTIKGAQKYLKDGNKPTNSPAAIPLPNEISTKNTKQLSRILQELVEIRSMLS